MEIGRVSKNTQKFTIRDLQEDHEYLIRIFARNEIGLSDPLESDEPFKVLPSGGKLRTLFIQRNLFVYHFQWRVHKVVLKKEKSRGLQTSKQHIQVRHLSKILYITSYSYWEHKIGNGFSCRYTDFQQRFQ